VLKDHNPPPFHLFLEPATAGAAESVTFRVLSPPRSAVTANRPDNSIAKTLQKGDQIQRRAIARHWPDQEREVGQCRAGARPTICAGDDMMA
jgi:hypothetical protein